MMWFHRRSPTGNEYALLELCLSLYIAVLFI